MGFWQKTLFKGKGKYSSDIRVIEDSGTRKLTIDGYTQSQNVRLDGSVGYPLWEKMIPPETFLNEDSRVLLLGLGAGTLSKIITKKFGAVTIDGVEIDPLVVEIGKKYFSMNEPNLNIIISDGVEFVKNARFKYDFICVDIFQGRKIPEEVLTSNFFKSVKRLLKKDGIASANKIFSGLGERDEFESFIRSMFSKTSFNTIESSGKFENIIVYIIYLSRIEELNVTLRLL